jgi:3-oxoacyl-[acyl-carrier-protein] synthase-3
MYHSQVVGLGHYVPEEIVTNDMLSERMPTTDQWIVERTGIKQRHYFKEGFDTVSSMGTRAALMACESAGISHKEVDCIVFATITSDYYFPGSGVLMQRELGLAGIPAIDIKMQCSGFIYALSIADQFIKTGMYKTILVVGSEVQSNAMEFTERDRHVSVIFADGAGACLLRATTEKDRGILSTHLHSDGLFAEELMMEHPGSRLKNRLTNEMLQSGALLPTMNGPVVFKHAVIRFQEVIEEALKANGTMLMTLIY